ncbi:Six-hairpin glycosidase [Acididesulfobacillus acetoxydans]|uniref:Six-hairpin glycosidase n=1 Tax=Acididesulfobacillus acetoxydans TaxID=1561005 RepID=A0A8S0W3K3_9FIRM|nr:Six-hairpin glycosidase [Acididesulfobacillus acetoxydans]CEJ09198.1 Spermatogenesis-associated protein 20 [Acididesulfobacillus acetoxydans]
MAHESFEDDSVAGLLNSHFVSIKVDREERPDVDHQYIEFCQALTGSAGWPLTILMTPEREPFFAGTYFPKTQRWGRPGLIEILGQIRDLWSSREADLRTSAREIVSSLQNRQKGPAHTDALPVEHEGRASLVQSKTRLESVDQDALFDRTFAALSRSFDPEWGGFGRPPKFPTPHTLTFLLRYALTHPSSGALAMVEKTLDGMGQGGIFDHIGLGFSRYSTDERWLIPHFEKMLYDNALLALAYTETFQASHRDQDRRKVEEIVTYVLRTMTSPEGGFYSAEDADSEGSEGKFYTWSPAEIAAVLGTEAAELFCAAYGISEAGNFEGKSVPNLIGTDFQRLARERNLTSTELERRLTESRQKLFRAREQRVHPHKDDKILAGWNGLMIAALSKAARVLDRQSYLGAAEKALDFIMSRLRRPDGRLLARYREGESAYPAYLDDYAYIIWGLLEVYTAAGEPFRLKTAIELQTEQDRLFRDTRGGGYFFTGLDGEELLFRSQELYDGALPSGNSVSALNLLRLARLTGEPHWEDQAQKLLLAWQETVSSHPEGCTAYLQALQFARYGGQELVLAGSLEAPTLEDMRRVFFRGFHPFATLLYREENVDRVVPWLKDYPVPDETTAAYLCREHACLAPVVRARELLTLLNDSP